MLVLFFLFLYYRFVFFDYVFFFILFLLGIDLCFIIVWWFYIYWVVNKWYMCYIVYFYVWINIVYSFYSDVWIGREKWYRENMIKLNNYIYRERISCCFLYFLLYILNRVGWCLIFFFRIYFIDNSRLLLCDS